MKMLNTPQEIAVAINMHEMPVVRIDLQMPTSTASNRKRC